MSELASSLRRLRRLRRLLFDRAALDGFVDGLSGVRAKSRNAITQ